MEAGDLAAAALGPREKAALDYAQALTLDPGGMRADMVAALRQAGWSLEP